MPQINDILAAGYNVFTVILTPNETLRRFDVQPSRSYRVFSATGRFAISPGDQAPREFYAGCSLVLQDQFDRVQLSNLTSLNNTVVFAVSSGFISDDRLLIQTTVPTALIDNTVTNNSSNTGKSVTTGTTTLVLAARAGDKFRHVQNIGGYPIGVGFGSAIGRCSHLLYPGDSWSFSYAGDVYAYAIGSDSILSVISEGV